MQKKIKKDTGVLAEFIYIYCSEKHRQRDKKKLSVKGNVGDYLDDFRGVLCEECSHLLIHGTAKRIICPHEPKPSCRHCTTQCYRDGYRERIREVMRFSGMHLIKKGRLGLLKKYFF